MCSSGLQSALACPADLSRHTYMNEFGWRSSSFAEVRFVISLSIWMVLKLKHRKSFDVLKVWYILQSTLTLTEASPPSLMKWVLIVYKCWRINLSATKPGWHLLAEICSCDIMMEGPIHRSQIPQKTMKLLPMSAFIIMYWPICLCSHGMLNKSWSVLQRNKREVMFVMFRTQKHHIKKT